MVVTIPLKNIARRACRAARGQGRDRHQQLLPAARRPHRRARRRVDDDGRTPAASPALVEGGQGLQPHLRSADHDRRHACRHAESSRAGDCRRRCGSEGDGDATSSTSSASTPWMPGRSPRAGASSATRRATARGATPSNCAPTSPRRSGTGTCNEPRASQLSGSEMKRRPRTRPPVPVGAAYTCRGDGRPVRCARRPRPTTPGTSASPRRARSRRHRRGLAARSAARRRRRCRCSTRGRRWSSCRCPLHARVPARHARGFHPDVAARIAADDVLAERRAGTRGRCAPASRGAPRCASSAARAASVLRRAAERVADAMHRADEARPAASRRRAPAGSPAMTTLRLASLTNVSCQTWSWISRLLTTVGRRSSSSASRSKALGERWTRVPASSSSRVSVSKVKRPKATLMRALRILGNPLGLRDGRPVHSTRRRSGRHDARMATGKAPSGRDIWKAVREELAAEPVRAAVQHARADRLPRLPASGGLRRHRGHLRRRSPSRSARR